MVYLNLIRDNKTLFMRSTNILEFAAPHAANRTPFYTKHKKQCSAASD